MKPSFRVKLKEPRATLGEVLAQEAGISVSRDPHDLQEVHNYIVALDYGLKRLQDLPLSLRLIKEIHEKLMQGVRGSHDLQVSFAHPELDRKSWVYTKYSEIHPSESR